MNIKHHEIAIPKDTPFANCKLQREPYAKVLTEIVGTFADGFVLAINNEWGTGKTTFAKMWMQSLSNDGFQTVYFNAWENDFLDDPRVAIMAELKPLIKGKVDGEKLFKSVLEKGAVLTKTVAPALLMSLIKKHVVDTGPLEEAIKNVTEATAGILEEQIREYSDKKKTVAEFRKELESFVKKKDSDKPLIFIIDELDRCRPNYAVEVLEQLKHFFSVDGIVFVLSIDKQHLASSVRGFYGSEGINTDEYLRRFIDLEYSLPKPSNDLFCEYLFEYYEFSEFFFSKERRQLSPFRDDAILFRKMAESLFSKGGATLRQQEKLFALARLILKSFKPNNYAFPHLLFVLVYLKVMRNEFYREIGANALTLQQLSNKFVDVLPLFGSTYGFNAMFVLALLLFFYNNSQDDEDRVALIESTPDGQLTTPIKIETRRTGSLADTLNLVVNNWDYRNVGLKYLMNKIDLMESVTMN
jgi:hypothetical protein